MEFLTIREAAAALRYNAEVLRRLAKRGKLPAVRFGKKWLVPKSYLQVLAGEKEQKSDEQQK